MQHHTPSPLRVACFKLFVALGAVAAMAGTATAGYVETFDDGQNNSGWTWDLTADGSVLTTGGNPGGYFNSGMMTIPSLFTSDALFTGDFRARGVSSIGGDLAAIEYGSWYGPISLVLTFSNGTTPTFDDTYAYYVTSIAAPSNPSFGWVSFDVQIASTSTTTPDGWVLMGAYFQPPTVDWNTLITHVDQVIIAWNDPRLPVPVYDQIRGADNLRIDFAPIPSVPEPGTAALWSLALGLGAWTRRRQRTSLARVVRR